MKRKYIDRKDLIRAVSRHSFSAIGIIIISAVGYAMGGQVSQLSLVVLGIYLFVILPGSVCLELAEVAKRRIDIVLRWNENTPNERDIELARRLISEPAVAKRIRELDGQKAQPEDDH